MTLDLIVEPGLEPEVAIAQDRHLLHEAAGSPRGRRGVLRVYDVPGERVSLGRYHMMPSGDRAALARRHSGGRAAPLGDGFVGLSLVLPHRSALVAPDDPWALAPAQVMNRCVRGLLGACDHLGVPAFYPGRDLVTVAGRPLAVVAFEVDAAGALLFEAIVAVERELGRLAGLLDAVDPDGVVRAELLLPEDTTSLARVRGRAPAREELIEALVRGHVARLGVAVEPRRFTAKERETIARLAADEVSGGRWLGQRRLRPELPDRPWTRTQLGVLEVHLARAGGMIAEAMLAGDFIAPSASVERLEAALRGCPLADVDAVVARVLAPPADFVLGIGADDVIGATIRKAFAA